MRTRKPPGKTTCLVLRMFAQWCEARDAQAQDLGAPPCRQMFVTASATLKNQVRARLPAGRLRCILGLTKAQLPTASS